MSSGVLTMQVACQDIANLHTYSEIFTPPWLSTQHTAYEGRSLRQCLRFEILRVGEKLNCGRLGYGTLYCGGWFIKIYEGEPIIIRTVCFIFIKTRSEILQLDNFSTQSPCCTMHFVHHRTICLWHQNKMFWAERQATHAPLHPVAGPW